MKLSFYGVAVIVMCLFVACASDSLKNSISREGIAVQDVSLVPKPEEQTSPIAMADSAVKSTNTTDDIPLQSGSPTYTDWDKKIVKTARLSLEVKDFKAFNIDIHNRTKNFGAYTAAEQQNGSDTRIENNLTIKVPVDQFDNFVNSVGGDGITILSKEISTEDVSSELVDAKARIEAKKQLRDKYEELLKEAKTMKDILQVQSEINNIQEVLEAAAGRVNYLSHSAAYSTVTISYFQYLNGTTSDTAKPGFLISLKEAFATGSSVFINVVLFFISIWPLLLTGGFLFVYFKRNKIKKATV